MKPARTGLHWASMGESTFVLGIWFLYGVHRALGPWPFRLCLYPVVLTQWALRPALRRASLQYLQRLEQATGALGRVPGWRDTLRHMLLFAETLLDKLLAVAGRYPLQRVQTQGREPLYRASQAGQGGLIVVAHMGCLELCRAMAEQGKTLRLHVLVHTRHATEFNRILKRLNPTNEVQLLEVTEISPATALLLSEKVGQGEYVVIAGDRVPVLASQTVSADFLGHPAPLPVGPYVLASLLKCPLYFLGCIHQGAGYAVQFELLAQQVLLPRTTRQQAMAHYASLYAQAVTAQLVRSPYDWFNFFPFWEQTHDTTPSRARDL